MIELINVTKYYITEFGKHYVFRNVSLVLPLDKSVAVIGPNGAGKSTFLRIIAGSDMPSEGIVRRTGRISPPMGLTPGLQTSLNAVENARFAGRIYGLNRGEINDMIDHVRQVANIGKYFDVPVATYSAGMRQRVAFAINMCLDFDYYIFDEVSAGGDREFRKMSSAMVAERLKTSKFVLASHRKDELANLCESGIVIQNGELKFFEDIRDALAYYGDDDDDDEKPARKARRNREGGEADSALSPAEAEAAEVRRAAKTQLAQARLERIQKVKALRQAEAEAVAAVTGQAAAADAAPNGVAADATASESLPKADSEAAEARRAAKTQLAQTRLERIQKVKTLRQAEAEATAAPEDIAATAVAAEATAAEATASELLPKADAEATEARRAAKTQLAQARLERIQKVKTLRQAEAEATAAPADIAAIGVAAEATASELLPKADAEAAEARRAAKTLLAQARLERIQKVKALRQAEAEATAALADIASTDVTAEVTASESLPKADSEAADARRAAKTQKMEKARLERIQRVKALQQDGAEATAAPADIVPTGVAAGTIVAESLPTADTAEARDTTRSQNVLVRLERQPKLRLQKPKNTSATTEPTDATEASPPQQPDAAAAERARGLARRAFLSQEEAQVKASRALRILLRHLDTVSEEDPEVQQHRIAAVLAAQRAAALELAKARRMLEAALNDIANSEPQAADPSSRSLAGAIATGPARSRIGA